VLLVHSNQHVSNFRHHHAQDWWVLVQSSFDPMQETDPKVGGGHCFAGGTLFVRLWLLVFTFCIWL